MARTRMVARRFARRGRRAPVHAPASALAPYESTAQRFPGLLSHRRPPTAPSSQSPPLAEAPPIVWLDIEPTTWTTVELHRLLEYMALLGFQARVDAGAFYDSVIGLFGDDGCHLVELHGGGHPQETGITAAVFQLGFRFIQPPTPTLTALVSRLRLDWAQDEALMDFRAQRAILRGAGGCEAADGRATAFTVPWILETFPTEETNTTIAELLAIDRGSSSPRTSHVALSSSPFRLTAVAIGACRAAPFGIDAWSQLASIGHATAIEGFGGDYLRTIGQFAPASVVALRELFHCDQVALTSSRGAAQSSTATSTHVRSVTISALTDRDHLLATCTALADSDTVGTVTITDGYIAVGVDQAQCLAFALYSPTTGAIGVHTLEIPASALTDQLRGAVAEAMTDSAALLPFLDGTYTTNPWVRLPASTAFQLQDPRTAEQPVTCLSLPHPLVVLTLRDNTQPQEDSTRCKVLLPGWGPAWVPKASAETLVTPSSRRPRHGIKRLHINELMPEHVDDVVAFLELTGSDLTSLELEGQTNFPVSDDSLLQVLRACPHLEELFLNHVAITSLQPLIETYSSGRCRIQCLTLWKITIGDHESIHDLFQVLSNPQHPLTTQLRELTYDITETMQPNSTTPTCAIIDSCTQMLRKNNRLIICRAKTRTLESPETFAAIFASENQRPLSIAKCPLAFSSRIAFLHVSKLRGFRLGEFEIRLMFDFAAEVERRVCDLYHF